MNMNNVAATHSCSVHRKVTFRERLKRQTSRRLLGICFVRICIMYICAYIFNTKYAENTWEMLDHVHISTHMCAL